MMGVGTYNLGQLHIKCDLILKKQTLNIMLRCDDMDPFGSAFWPGDATYL